MKQYLGYSLATKHCFFLLIVIFPFQKFDTFDQIPNSSYINTNL